MDNTLYSCRYGLEDNVARRIREFTAAYLGISPEEAWQMRLANMRQYGTCLEWLVKEKGLTDTEAYLAAIHPDGEAETLPPDEELRDFLAAIPIPKAILTNSTREHADLILGKLGITGLFTRIFDIRECGYIGKPRPEVFNNALRNLGVRAEETLFIDDSPFYTESFIAMGGNALLFDERDVHRNAAVPKILDLREIAGYI